MSGLFQLLPHLTQEQNICFRKQDMHQPRSKSAVVTPRSKTEMLTKVQFAVSSNRYPPPGTVMISPPIFCRSR
jgi:hypothetical protein